MKFVSIALIVQFLSVSGAESLVWNSIIMIPSCTSGQETNIVYPVSNGDVHIFRNCDFLTRINYLHQIKYSNGTLSPPNILDKERFYSYKYDNYPVLSVGVSRSEQHLIFTYHGSRVRSVRRCDFNNFNGCTDIFYTESTNGGKNWIDPIRLPKPVMNDTINRYSPSIVYEKDTGRVYIAYASSGNNIFSISIREPNKSTFEYPIDVPVSMSIAKLKLLQTHDKQTSKKYLHLFFTQKSDKSLYYTRSSDGGKTWNTAVKILGEITVNRQFEIIGGIEAAELTIYIQYYKSPDIRLMFSKNNGISWESSFKSGSDLNNLNSLAICGNKEKAYILSMSAKSGTGNGYVRYNILYERFFKNLKYPFDRAPETNQPNIQCIYNGNNRYNVTAILVELKKSIVHLAQGVMST